MTISEIPKKNSFAFPDVPFIFSLLIVVLLSVNLLIQDARVKMQRNNLKAFGTFTFG